jgi:hypothetical protein
MLDSELDVLSGFPDFRTKSRMVIEACSHVLAPPLLEAESVHLTLESLFLFRKNGKSGKNRENTPAARAFCVFRFLNKPRRQRKNRARSGVVSTNAKG